MRQVHGHAIGHGHRQQDTRDCRDVAVQTVFQQQSLDSPFVNANSGTVHLTAHDYPAESGCQLVA
jgi:hypothetical protein